jgi:PAS domain S-box-containing protein
VIEAVVLALSLLLQLTAALLSLRLIRLTGHRTAWVLLAVALALMAIRRCITLARVIAGDASRPPDLSAELVALTISVLLVFGIAYIAPHLATYRRKEREVTQLLEAAPEAMVIADAGDRIVRVNAQAVRLFGYLRGELESMRVEQLMPERFRARHSERRRKYSEHPRPRLLGEQEELYALRKDGSEFPVELSVNPLEAVGGQLVVSSIRDISARREAERSIKESEGRYRSLLDDVLDSASVGVCILDADFHIVWVNRAFESYFEVKRAEVIGFDARRIVPERLQYRFEDPKGFSERLLATYEENSYVEQFECHVPAEEGQEELWLEHRSQPIDSGVYRGGRIEHYADITERKRAEERIRLFARIARNMQIGLLVYRQDDLEDDRSLRLIAVNPEGAKLLGLEADLMLGCLIDDLFPILRERGIPRVFADVIRTGTAQDLHDFQYGDERVLESVWSFRAFPLPNQSVGVVFESIAERRRTEELVREIAAGVAGESGPSFFRSLVRHLARSLGLEYAVVGALEEGGVIRTVAMCEHGRVVDNLSYELSGTPCQHVVGRGVCCHPRNVAALFPADSMLAEMGAECYVGAPLMDSAGRPLGLIAVLGQRELSNPELAISVLQIFAAHAAVELERRKREEQTD